jgi:hypothetical protein
MLLLDLSSDPMIELDVHHRGFDTGVQAELTQHGFDMKFHGPSEIPRLRAISLLPDPRHQFENFTF